jgi:hypothetical protein
MGESSRMGSEVWRLVRQQRWKHGQRTNTPNLRPRIKVSMGETGELVVDSNGKLCGLYGP